MLGWRDEVMTTDAWREASAELPRFEPVHVGVSAASVAAFRELYLRDFRFVARIRDPVGRRR